MAFSGQEEIKKSDVKRVDRKFSCKFWGPEGVHIYQRHQNADSMGRQAKY